jgi:hypothetical protein
MLGTYKFPSIFLNHELADDRSRELISVGFRYRNAAARSLPNTQKPIVISRAMLASRTMTLQSPSRPLCRHLCHPQWLMIHHLKACAFMGLARHEILFIPFPINQTRLLVQSSHPSPSG